MDEVAVEIPGQVWKTRMTSDYDFQYSHQLPPTQTWKSAFSLLQGDATRDVHSAIHLPIHPSIHPSMISSVLGIR